MTKKPLYAGNEVMVDLDFPLIQAIEKQSKRKVEIKSTSEIQVEESSIQESISSGKETQA